MEHEEYQLAGEIASFHDQAPSLDGIGVNSYYLEQISQLNHIAYKMDPTRPYMVSEFGPRGYWNPDYTIVNKDSMALEDSEREKVRLYTLEWSKYVAGKKGFNIGGYAYSWRDRYEGTNTWYGVSDYKGRLKPVYHALKKLWTGKDEGTVLIASIETPNTTLIPGKTYNFKADVNTNDDNLTYEWELRANEYLEKVNAVDFEDNGSTIKLTIPDEASKYRLYLFVSDERGNVSATSHPIMIR
jgi:hypothetical protein